MNGESGDRLAGWRDRLLLHCDEVAALLNVSSRTVWRLAAMGDLAQPVKVRKSARFKVSDVEAYMEHITAERDGNGGGER